MKADIDIDSATQWGMFSEQKLQVILDPMIFRFGDVFVGGGGSQTETAWAALSTDLTSLTTFFDQLILCERLPLIDYGVTFDSALGYDSSSLAQRINTALDEKVVHTVHVHDSASAQAREAALAALQTRSPAPPELVRSIFAELGALDYSWNPDLGQLQNLPEEELKLARFAYGGLMFSAFSQLSGSMQVLQPKRSRLLTALSLATASASYKYEDELFAALDRRVEKSPDLREIGFASLPSFVPYLLREKNPKTPQQLLEEVRHQRRKPAVREYRKWRDELQDDWVQRGLIKSQNERALRRVAERLRDEFAVNRTVDLEIGAGAQIGTTGVGIDAGVSVPIPVDRIWGWILEQLPGHRYIKLLTRLRLAKNEYEHLDRHLYTLWKSA